jgi:hypothetical protein
VAVRTKHKLAVFLEVSLWCESDVGVSAERCNGAPVGAPAGRALIYVDIWCPAELNLHLVVEIDFLLTLNRNLSAPEFYGIYSNRSLVCACKLAKLCCPGKILRDGYRE